jgi:GH15 family glucan-1,4-alpha-glucosidase
VTAPSIADYGFLSDCRSAALVSRDGSLDWWCLPRFDSPSLFGRLLDADAGHWSLRPTQACTVERTYVGESLVLRTVFRTPGGAVALTDALAFALGARGHAIGADSPGVLLRRVEGLEGEVHLRMEFAPRFEYGRTVPRLRWDSSRVVAQAGPVSVYLSAPVDVTLGAGAAEAEFTVRAGDALDFSLAYAPTFGGAAAPPALDARTALADTVAGWESWAALHTGYQGRYLDQVRRSAAVLQGLTYQPSGAVIAAATTSLPEEVGGDLNWDYRFAWLRDVSLTMQAQWVAACPHEASRFFLWLGDAMGELGDQPLQIVFGVEGERDLTEHALSHLRGYRDSRPVRVGNDAWEQRQLDVLGEVLFAAHLLRDQLGPFEERTQRLLVSLAGQAADSWHKPDAGMWEARDAERHYTSSKVMCWVALDRAVRLADRLGDGADAERWAQARDEVRSSVLEQAWCASVGAYTGAFGSDRLDASVLLLPLVGFLPADDERMRATIEAVASGLTTEDGLVYRWDGDTATFVICSYWLVECLALAGETDRAAALFERVTAHANDLGLLAEEIDAHTGEQLGNFPQAFSHVGLINAAWQLTQGAPA